MARIFIVDGAGARAGDLEAARARFDDANREAFGADLDVHAHTPQNQIAGINALVATELGEELVRAALYGASINHARGAFLDALGSLLDIRREQQTHSRVIATLTGVAGTRVPAGRFAKNANGDTFASDTDAIISEGGTRVGFTATEPGPKDVSANSLTQIVSTISGWDTITNEADGITGRNTESDARFRANLKARTAHSSVGSIAALESALASAGATKIRVLENSTASTAVVSGVSLPAHSILVIADGGLFDDISRAVENHRGMGVNTYTVAQGGDITLATAQTIRNGRMTFNGVSIHGFDLNGQTISGIVSRLNAVTSEVEFSSSGNQLLTLHSWNPNTTGYEDVGGNVSETSGLLPAFVPTTADILGTQIRLAFPSLVANVVQSNIAVKYTASDNSEGTAALASVAFFANMVNITLSSALPAGATSPTIEISSIDSAYSAGLSVARTPLATKTAGATDSPIEPILYGEPRDRGGAVWAISMGTITKWQGRIFQNGAYISPDWVDIPSTNFSDPLLLTGASNAGFPVSSLTNNSPARVDIRAVNGTHGATATSSVIINPTDNAPAIEEQRIDGNLITLRYSLPLKPSIVTSGLTQWTATLDGNAVAITKQRAAGNIVELTTATPLADGDSGTIACATPSAGPFGLNNIAVGTFTARALTNDALSGVPSKPIGLTAYRGATSWNASWETNHNGGLAVDSYQVSTLPQGSTTWSSWLDLAAASRSYTAATTAAPAGVRVRASNPNARAASILMLTEDASTYPFARSISRPLVIGIEIHRDSTITTDDFTAIKTSLISLIDSYDIGATLWQADLQARVESLASIRLATPLTVTTAGVAVNGEAQNAYTRWTLSPDDITITFVN